MERKTRAENEKGSEVITFLPDLIRSPSFSLSRPQEPKKEERKEKQFFCSAPPLLPFLPIQIRGIAFTPPRKKSRLFIARLLRLWAVLLLLPIALSSISWKKENCCEAKESFT